VVYLSENTVNTVSVDAPQTALLDDPNYFFVFFHTQTQETYKTYLVRNNLTSARYGEFTITLPTDLLLTNGTYEYSIYENANAVDTDEALMNQLERGLAFVFDTPITSDTYEAGDKISAVYGNS
jgi:hypothetical protein